MVHRSRHLDPRSASPLPRRHRLGTRLSPIFRGRTVALSMAILIAFSPVSWHHAARAAAYVDPTTGKPSAATVLRPFDPPEHDWLPGHRGVDLAAKEGQVILAADGGTIAFAGVVAGTPVVSVDHRDGIRTTYQPVRAMVRPGDVVAQGEPIGVLARPRDNWPGLHWGARPISEAKAYINPLSLLDEPTIRLKPITKPAGAPAETRGAADPPTRAYKSAWSASTSARESPEPPADPRLPQGDAWRPSAATHAG